MDTEPDKLDAIIPIASLAPRHVIVTGPRSLFHYARCEAGCVVTPFWSGSSCGRDACPQCGSGGTNLTLRSLGQTLALECTCGNSWQRVPELIADQSSLPVLAA